ncbi:unnamed protein product [Lactuca saligna]|uniref:Peptidase M3A/M3B catalytic domain-containing protein n=1 Tax=Lactuca saligna TaxID=75948 RepID=A0AA35ZGU3_LACSI|nr:unnamed protein product [Lactuca saligna]
MHSYMVSAEKRGGAWMDEVVARSRVLSGDKNSARLPISHMVCNQMPPVGDKPSLMTFRESDLLPTKHVTDSNSSSIPVPTKTLLLLNTRMILVHGQ